MVKAGSPAVTPQPGDFGLSRIGGRLGWWITILQALAGDASRYTHAFVYVPGGVVEARPGGARFNPHAQAGVVSWEIPLTVPQRLAIVDAALDLVGTPYSFLDYLSLTLDHFRIRPGFVLRRVTDSGHLICSQLVDLAYLRAGVHLFADARDAGDVTPGDLGNLLIETDWKVWTA